MKKKNQIYKPKTKIECYCKICGTYLFGIEPKKKTEKLYNVAD